MPSIVHLDADAFFASVEQASDTRLRGKPVAVGGERRGIIASASYEARKFGVYTPMPTVLARKLCPKLIVLPGDFERYEQFSNWMFGVCYDFTPDVEQSSIDEGYFDLSRNRTKPPLEIAQAVRRAIAQSLKICVSEGIGTSKLVSQIASKLNKPAAFCHVPAGSEKAFLHPLPNQWLPGVGPKTSARLNSAGLTQIRHIAATPIEMLELLLGGQARSLRQFANGIDERPLVPLRAPAKSFSQQETFPQDLTDEEYLEAVLRRMADRLFAKVREEGKSIRTLTVKVRYNDMAEDQCSESLPDPTDLETDVYGRLRSMLRSAWKRRVSLRLVSLKLSNVYDGLFRSELPLENGARQQESRERLARAVDDLRRAHGGSILLRGHDFVLKDESRIQNPESRRRNEAIEPAALRNRQSAIGNRQCYIPLRVRSYYSFLDSTLSPEAIVRLAARYDCPAVALTDTGNLHGAADFAQAAAKAGIRPIFGAELTLENRPLLLYVESARGYRNLCRLLSQQNAETVSSFRLQHSAFLEGLIAVSGDPRLAELFPGRFYTAASRESASGAFLVIACPAVHYGAPEDRLRYDIVQSIRTLTLLRQAHPEKRMGGRYHFRTPPEMRAGCREHPEWLERAREIADRCRFEFPFGKPQFPVFRSPGELPSREFLRRLAIDGLRRRYQGRRIVSDTGAEIAWEQVRAQIETELRIITEVGYEDLFLITWDLLQTCRERGIEWITRGSAADSLVCYCLGISDVCPIRFGLYFRRFLNKERMALHKLPDIDVDFPHDRKDGVIDLLFEKYGPEHCAVVGGFSTFQARSAVADVGKILGLSEFQIRRFTEHFPWGFPKAEGRMQNDETSTFCIPPSSFSPHPSALALCDALRARPECRDLPLDEEPYKTAVEMAAFLDGFPRHPKMHPCGVVLSRQPLHELTPTFLSGKGWPTTHLDMDAVEAVGLVKMDILAQGGLAVMRDTPRSLAEQGIRVELPAPALPNRQSAIGNRQSMPPPDIGGYSDPLVWDMIAGGHARGVHHIESPAMVSLCSMCNVREIDGLIAIVSVIRPGAANENKKLAFTRRYQGMEPPQYPHPSLEPCLRSTFGLVVYEEHILQLCEAFAGLSPGRGDVLRRALVKQNWDAVREIAIEFNASARARGHDPETIREVWALATGFNGYAFCKAHSTAYGVEAYQAAWLKRYHPAEFMAAVLTHGKGFYQPLVYALECHRLGISFLPPSVNQPGPEFRAEGRMQNAETSSFCLPPSTFIRAPLVRAKGLTQRTADRLLAERERGLFASPADFYRRVRPAPEEAETMVRIGAFDEFGQTRTQQFWELQGIRNEEGSVKKAETEPGEIAQTAFPFSILPSSFRIPCALLQEPSRRQRLQWEADCFGFTLTGHPLDLHPDVAWNTYCPVARLGEHVGEEVTTCGLIVEQRTHHQATGEPMKFLTLADWTGMVETELFTPTYRSYGLATVRYPVLEVTARVEAFENGRGFSLRVLRAGKPRISEAQPR